MGLHFEDQSGPGMPDAARGSTQLFECCGVRVAATSVSAAADEIIRRGMAMEKLEVHLCNAYTLSLAMRSRPFRNLLNQADLNLPDGTPVSWVASATGTSGVTGPVPGPELMVQVFNRDATHLLRHFLYGSTPSVLQRLETVLTSRFPGCQIVGRLAPDFGPVTSEMIGDAVGSIKDSRAGIVWVGLGTPKQDQFAAALTRLTPVVAVPVGAAFDFLSGNKPEAPTWIRATGFEWVFRLATEPRRLWRRYLFGNLLFLAGAVGSVARAGLRSRWGAARKRRV